MDVFIEPPAYMRLKAEDQKCSFKNLTKRHNNILLGSRWVSLRFLDLGQTNNFKLFY